MKTSIIIPVFNEVHTIEHLLARVAAVPIDQEIVVVDDFSTDGIREVLTALSGYPNLRVLLHDRNRGKGAALRTGLAVATGDIVLVQDADLEYNPDEYSRLLQPILDGRADVVFGSRFSGGECYRVLFTTLSNVFTNLTLTDVETCTDQVTAPPGPRTEAAE